MKHGNRKQVLLAVLFLVVFVLWTVLVCWVDVQPIGPGGSAVGFGTLNSYVHDLTGVHMGLYVLTDWLSLIPLGIVAGFALLGLTQWIRRKRLRRVDADILILGGFYVTVMALFLLFEELEINYRPILIQGTLEASYPSSTTMLVLCVMPTAMMQLRGRMGNSRGKRLLSVGMSLFTAFMVAARLISGVHWVTDIVGSVLLSAGLVLLYRSMVPDR